MSVIVRCDAEGCGREEPTGCIDYSPDMPSDWLAVSLEHCGYEVKHACSEECRQKIMECEQE